MFLQKKISKNVLKDLKKTIESINLEKEKLLEITCTKNGYQSRNIFSFFKKSLLKKAINYKDFHKHVFHIHYIEYGKGGYQELHSHETTEEFSFIIYLNNADGNTFFHGVLKGRPAAVVAKPEEGKIVIFSSHYGHEAKVSNKNKKVLVGAIFKK